MKSKTLTGFLALTLGPLGFHRFYLYGKYDRYAWLHIASTLAGLAGFFYLKNQRLDSILAWIGLFFGSISLLAAFLSAIVYSLRPDQKWDQQFNSDTKIPSQSGWGPVIVASTGLFIGTFLLMTELAVIFQLYFESQSNLS